MRVDFAAEGGVAKGVFAAVSASVGGKSGLVAALLALFLGSLGIHKFYLGYKTPGIILLICGTVGWILILPGLAAAVVSLVEFVIYITKTDADFERIYVQGKKEWF